MKVGVCRSPHGQLGEALQLAHECGQGMRSKVIAL